MKAMKYKKRIKIQLKEVFERNGRRSNKKETYTKEKGIPEKKSM